MTDPQTARRPIKVQYHDDGIVPSWLTDDPRVRRAIHLPVDDAIGLAHAMQHVTDDRQVDERTKVFRVQWYDGGVLVSHQLAGDDWTRLHLPMCGARIVVDAIMRCVTERDVLAIHDDEIDDADPDDFLDQYPDRNPCAASQDDQNDV